MIGKAFMMREGSPDIPSAVMYSRCLDERYVRAELLVMFHSKQLTQLPPDKTVVAYYDLDPSVPLAEFLGGYTRARKTKLKAYLDSPWEFRELPLKPIAGFRRPAFGVMCSEGMPAAALAECMRIDHAEAKNRK